MAKYEKETRSLNCIRPLKCQTIKKTMLAKIIYSLQYSYTWKSNKNHIIELNKTLKTRQGTNSVFKRYENT